MLDVLTSAGFDARPAVSGEAAVAAVAEREPDVIVLDIRLPGISGYEVCRRVREEHGNRIGIMFISGFRADSLDRVAGLLIGADDHLAKPFAPDELIARVRRIALRGQDSLDEPAAGNGSIGHHGRDGSGYGLTDREHEVLDLLASGLDQRAVALRLVVSHSTVATHIQHILDKLDVHNRAQAVALAHREGLVDPGH